MRHRLPRVGLHVVFLWVLIPAWTLLDPVVASGAEAQKSVLLIYDNRSDMKGNIAVDQAIRKVLGEQFGFNLDIRSEYFEVSASPQKDFPLLLSWLRRKYAGRTFDVVVAVGANALGFVESEGDELFKGAQIVFLGRGSAVGSWRSSQPITGVVAPEMNRQVEGTVAFIRGLQPDLERLIVISGTSSLDRAWEAAARHELGPIESQIAITYLAGLPLEDVIKELSKLPPKTAIFFLSISEDGAGRTLLRSQYLDKLVAEAAAPVYGPSALYLDTGIVGGALLDQESMGLETGAQVVRLLRGEDIREIPFRETSLVPMGNWRALTRWGLAPDKLPRGTVLRYKDPTLWESYRWHVIVAASLCLLEAGLIVALLVHRANRKRAEKAMVESKRLLQSTIDALNFRVAMLDKTGNIIAANQSWTTFINRNGYADASRGAGYNYLQIFESNGQCEESRKVSVGLRRLMSGELEDFHCIYPSVQTDGTCWYQVRASRFLSSGEMRLVVTHEDVTEIKQAHEAQQELTGLLMQAQDEERRRIARDLHDVTVQNMVAIKANLTFAENRPRDPAPVRAETLRESMSLCDQVIKELRTLSYLLHPPFLDEVGLGPAVQWFVRGFVQRSGIEVEVLMEDIGRLPKEVETALFRMVQETLTNIHRHSGSKGAVIWLTKEQDDVVLRVSDSGHGFSMPAIPENKDETTSPGVGILGMRQRLRQLGGQLDIESSSQGTTVNARVPISKDEYATNLVGG